MTVINAAITPMPEIEIFGFPALFTPHRVSRQTVHLGVYCYEIKAKLNEPDKPFSLMEQADGELFGTVLTSIPIDLPADGQREIKPGDFRPGEPAALYTPAEFEEKYFDPGYEPSRYAERVGK